METPVRLLKKATETALVVAPLDCAPRVNILLTAAVLSLFLLTLYIIVKWQDIAEFLNGLYLLAYEVLWDHRRKRYMSGILSLSCVSTAVTALLSDRPGGSWLLFYVSTCLQIFFAFIRIIQIWNAYRCPPDKLEDVWTTYMCVSSNKLKDFWNAYRYLPADQFEDLTAEWNRRTERILLSLDSPKLLSPQRNQPHHQSSVNRSRRKRSKFY